MKLLLALAVWVVIGRLIICSYRKGYCSKYPHLRKLQELEDKEVNEFRAEVNPLLRFMVDCICYIFAGLLWPYDIYKYYGWAEARMHH